MGHFARWWQLYQAIAFIALIPLMSYHVVSQGLPKKILLFVIPCYIVLAIAFYKAYKGLKPK